MSILKQSRKAIEEGAFSPKLYYATADGVRDSMELPNFTSPDDSIELPYHFGSVGRNNPDIVEAVLVSEFCYVAPVTTPNAQSVPSRQTALFLEGLDREAGQQVSAFQNYTEQDGQFIWQRPTFSSTLEFSLLDYLFYTELLW